MLLPKKEELILEQLKSEYQEGYDYIQPKRLQVLERMRLFSNQTRNKELVGDTTLFTIFQTVFSKLYEDKLNSNFVPNHPDDSDKVEALNPIAKYDYYQMNKDRIDYQWNWLTCFWGAGFLDVSEWDFKNSIMRPSVVNNAILLIDPKGSEVNGDQRGFGAFRFWQREIAKLKHEMKKEGFENIDEMRVLYYNTLKEEAEQYRKQAQNYGTPAEPVIQENSQIPLIEGWTHIDGAKWMFTTDAKFKKIVRTKEWKDDDFPLVQRKLFPIPDDPIGVSIPDLVEDKQRAKNILMNLTLASAKADLYPMKLYDRNQISPSTDLSHGFDKWVPVDGNPNTAYAPVQKNQLSQTVTYIMSLIDDAAQRATAANSTLQGAQSGSARSANEVVRVFNQAEERISTGAKVFGWSEREFWRWWLKNYRKYMPSAKKKFVRVEGAQGIEWLDVKGDDFKFERDPDIFIESKVLSDARNQNLKQSLIAFTNLTAQDTSLNRRYHNKTLAKIVGEYDSGQLRKLYPQSFDEMKAEQENRLLAQDKFVPIDETDDDLIHLELHAKGPDNKANIVHQETHKYQLMMKKKAEREQAAMQGNPIPESLGTDPLTVQQAPEMQGVGSSPSSEFINPNAVQQ
jgi:hypothetical protein